MTEEENRCKCTNQEKRSQVSYSMREKLITRCRKTPHHQRGIIEELKRKQRATGRLHKVLNSEAFLCQQLIAPYLRPPLAPFLNTLSKENYLAKR